MSENGSEVEADAVSNRDLHQFPRSKGARMGLHYCCRPGRSMVIHLDVPVRQAVYME
jgi:hypothetical protein